jgi:microsomal dipeptidase-like Zn-dependent dipeptidase
MQEISFKGMDILQEFRNKFSDNQYRNTRKMSENEKSIYLATVAKCEKYMREILNDNYSLIVHIEGKNPVDMDLNDIEEAYTNIMLGYTE